MSPDAGAELLQRRLSTIGEANTIVMRSNLQASKGDVFDCRDPEALLNDFRNALKPQFGVAGHTNGSRSVAGAMKPML